MADDNTGMKNKLSFQQKRMLIRALDNDGGNYGYAPCGQGFARTMRSLVAMELAIATGTVYAIRGIVLTLNGRELAKQIFNDCKDDTKTLS